MRLIRTLVPHSDQEAIVEVLDEQGVDYVVSEEETSRDAVILEFPFPAQAVEMVLGELRDAGHEDRYTVVVTAESAVAENFEELEDRFVTGGEEDESIAPGEIRATALDLTPNPVTYYSMTLLSAVVATAGLLLDSATVVVGSMVIAPLVGSALTASVGTVLSEREMILSGFRTQIGGLLLAVVGAAAFGFAFKTMDFLPPVIQITNINQISQRTSPGLLSVVIGACAGAAGAFSLATGVSVALVGVMIAAALLPAAAAVGIGVAWGLPSVTLGASLLLVLNTAAIHVSAVLVFWYLGYRPEGWERSGLQVSMAPRQLAASFAVVVVLAAVFAGTGGVVATHVQFDKSVNEAVTGLLEEPRYEELELLSTRSEFGGGVLPLGNANPQVTIVVSRPVDERYPELDRRAAEHIEDATGRRVPVVVQFVDQQRYRTPSGERRQRVPAGALQGARRRTVGAVSCCSVI